MKSPGLRALCGGKGIHPFRSPEAHLVNERWRCCGGIPVCRQQALLETGSLVQGAEKKRLIVLPLLVEAILITMSVENHSVQKERQL